MCLNIYFLFYIIQSESVIQYISFSEEVQMLCAYLDFMCFFCKGQRLSFSLPICTLTKSPNSTIFLAEKASSRCGVEEI